ncbi:Hypp751 [Branchiostoma lanceolatum]|uniref:Hypp751 protein n=1 Tax=Branchiostoma lanceolatum TaxID=7740 RepID=A0A8J9VC52_BRALA|nr:Hypp751 [Branchiostoma lanceolatum]
MDSTKTTEPSAVTFQPGTTRSRFQTAAPETEQGPIQIRKMEPQDIEFTGRIIVEAFHDKVEHAVGKSRMEDMTQLFTKILRRSTHLWHRYHVAMYEGKPAGAMVIKFHDDNAIEDFQCCETLSHVGCWGCCGILCMLFAFTDISIGAAECYVDTVGVDADYRGKGIGKALMERADSEARQRGCTSVFLWVKQSNRAVRLYERQGFVITHPFGTWFTGFATGCRDWYNMEKKL